MTDCELSLFCSITDGTFGEAEYFQGLVDNVNDMSKSNDWFLLANDFASYMDAQKQVDQVRHCSSSVIHSYLQSCRSLVSWIHSCAVYSHCSFVVVVVTYALWRVRSNGRISSTMRGGLQLACEDAVC